MVFGNRQDLFLAFSSGEKARQSIMGRDARVNQSDDVNDLPDAVPSQVPTKVPNEALTEDPSKFSNEIPDRFSNDAEPNQSIVSDATTDGAMNDLQPNMVIRSGENAKTTRKKRRKGQQNTSNVVNGDDVELC